MFKMRVRSMEVGAALEPVGDGSADSFFRQRLVKDARGHGCPRYEQWFMERVAAGR